MFSFKNMSVFCGFYILKFEGTCARPSFRPPIRPVHPPRPFTHPYVHPPVRRSIHQPTHPSICPSIHPPVRPPAHPIHLATHPSAHPLLPPTYSSGVGVRSFTCWARSQSIRPSSIRPSTHTHIHPSFRSSTRPPTMPVHPRSIHLQDLTPSAQLDLPVAPVHGVSCLVMKRP